MSEKLNPLPTELNCKGSEIGTNPDFGSPLCVDSRNAKMLHALIALIVNTQC